MRGAFCSRGYRASYEFAVRTKLEGFFVDGVDLGSAKLGPGELANDKAAGADLAGGLYGWGG